MLHDLVGRRWLSEKFQTLTTSLGSTTLDNCNRQRATYAIDHSELKSKGNIQETDWGAILVSGPKLELLVVTLAPPVAFNLSRTAFDADKERSCSSSSLR